MKKLIAFMILLWGGGALGAWYYHESQSQAFYYRTVRLSRGNLRAAINATGTLEPEEVVDVGAQIAGQIQTFGEDPRDHARPISYGSPVEQGTVLARIDDSVFKARVEQMKASLDRAEAEVKQAESRLRQARRDVERSANLYRRQQVSQQEHENNLTNQETAEAAVALANSAVALARGNLDEAEVNLAHATIKSPVKGVILDRRVNIGQTVVASLNAPSLFLIAKDLDRMEIWASVNETDIGAIHAGQSVQFSVASFPDETFRGTVAQIRLNASMTQSVVTYTVVVNVDNSSRRLLPYLTARLSFEVEGRQGVLLAPNSALRFKPKVEQVVPSSREAYEKDFRSTSAQTAASGPGDSHRPDRPAVVWARSGEFLRPVEVKLGLSDGQKTEILAGSDMSEGFELVVGQSRLVDNAPVRDDGSPASPFLPDLKRKKPQN